MLRKIIVDGYYGNKASKNSMVVRGCPACKGTSLDTPLGTVVNVLSIASQSKVGICGVGLAIIWVRVATVRVNSSQQVVELFTYEIAPMPDDNLNKETEIANDLYKLPAKRTTSDSTS